MQRLKDARLQLDIDKCEFKIEFIKYLEFIIKADKDIHINLAKIKTIIKWEISYSIKSIRAFIGFANFYHYFIKQFLEITKPLIELIKKDIVFK